MNPVTMKSWRAFLEAHASIVRQLEIELEELTGLPLTWYDALVQLHEAGGMLRVSELAGRVLLSRSATTRFVDRLEKEGLIERRPCGEDRRGTEVWLTEQGYTTLRRASPVHLGGVDRLFGAALDEPEHAALAELLARIPVRS